LEEQPFDAIVSNPALFQLGGRAMPTQSSSTTRVFRLRACWHQRAKPTLLLLCTPLLGFRQKGAAAIVCFPGILYRGGAEQKIRKYLVDNNFVDTIIQLPPDLFFGTSIATSIMVLKKNKQDNNILFIDASDKFVRGGNKNKLTDEHIEEILNAFTQRKDIPQFAKLVAYDTIVENDYNLAVSSYVEKEDTTEEIDIKKLNAEIEKIVARQAELRKAIDEM
jgi:Type I restriction-modification system methyltransferase subunit